MNGGINIPARVHTSVVDESSSRAQKSLEILPTQVLEQAGVFRRHVQYLLQPEPDRVVGPDLKLILDDIARAHKLDERVKDEILEDEDARNVSAGLFITFTNRTPSQTLSMLGFESKSSAQAVHISYQVIPRGSSRPYQNRGKYPIDIN